MKMYKGVLMLPSESIPGDYDYAAYIALGITDNIVKQLRRGYRPLDPYLSLPEVDHVRTTLEDAFVIGRVNTNGNGYQVTVQFKHDKILTLEILIAIDASGLITGARINPPIAQKSPA